MRITKEELKHIRFSGSQIRFLLIKYAESRIKSSAKRHNKSGDMVLELGMANNLARDIGDYIDTLLFGEFTENQTFLKTVIEEMDKPYQTTFGLIPEMPKGLANAQLAIICKLTPNGADPYHLLMPHQIYTEDLAKDIAKYGELFIYPAYYGFPVKVDGKRIWIASNNREES